MWIKICLEKEIIVFNKKISRQQVWLEFAQKHLRTAAIIRHSYKFKFDRIDLLSKDK